MPTVAVSPHLGTTSAALNRDSTISTANTRHTSVQVTYSGRSQELRTGTDRGEATDHVVGVVLGLTRESTVLVGIRTSTIPNDQWERISDKRGLTHVVVPCAALVPIATRRRAHASATCACCREALFLTRPIALSLSLSRRCNCCVDQRISHTLFRIVESTRQRPPRSLYTQRKRLFSAIVSSSLGQFRQL